MPWWCGHVYRDWITFETVYAIVPLNVLWSGWRRVWFRLRMPFGTPTEVRMASRAGYEEGRVAGMRATLRVDLESIERLRIERDAYAAGWQACTEQAVRYVDERYGTKANTQEGI